MKREVNFNFEGRNRMRNPRHLAEDLVKFYRETGLSDDEIRAEVEKWKSERERRSMPDEPTDIAVGGYTCPHCHAWVPDGQYHVCARDSWAPWALPEPTGMKYSDDGIVPLLKQILSELQQIKKRL